MLEYLELHGTPYIMFETHYIIVRILWKLLIFYEEYVHDMYQNITKHAAIDGAITQWMKNRSKNYTHSQILAIQFPIASSWCWQKMKDGLNELAQEGALTFDPDKGVYYWVKGAEKVILKNPRQIDRKKYLRRLITTNLIVERITKKPGSIVNDIFAYIKDSLGSADKELITELLRELVETQRISLEIGADNRHQYSIIE